MVRARYGRCLLGRRSVANTHTDGEHQTTSWTRSQGMSTRALSNAKTQAQTAIRCWISTFLSHGMVRFKYHKKIGIKNNNPGACRLERRYQFGASLPAD